MKTLILLLSLFTIACAKTTPEDAGLEGAAGPLEVSEDTLEVLQTASPGNESFFSFSNETYKLANGPARKWDGCATTALVRGGYNSDTQCSKGYFLPKFAQHLDDHLFACVERASLAANYPQPRKVFIRHLGTYVDRNGRNSNNLSMHAYARAIDLAKLILFDGQGSKLSVPLTQADYSGPTKKFYDSFRQCWKDSLPSKCQPGQSEYKGSIGHPGSALGGNSLHTKHIHLSFPFCGG